MRKYRIHLFDHNDVHLTDHSEETLKAAKAKARYLVTDDFAAACQSTHENLGTYKAVVFNTQGESVFELVRS